MEAAFHYFVEVLKYSLIVIFTYVYLESDYNTYVLCISTHWCVYVHIILNAGFMITTSHQTFPAKLSICPTKLNLARQIYNTLSMKIPLNLLKIVNVQSIFSPYHKHWNALGVCTVYNIMMDFLLCKYIHIWMFCKPLVSGMLKL